MGQDFDNSLSTNFLSVSHPFKVAYADLEFGSVAYLLDAERATLLLMASLMFSCERSNSWA